MDRFKGFEAASREAWVGDGREEVTEGYRRG